MSQGKIQGSRGPTIKLSVAHNMFFDVNAYVFLHSGVDPESGKNARGAQSGPQCKH